MTRIDRVLSARAENVLSAFRAIRENKLRSVLTCLGIIIGVATVIVMVSLIEGFNNQFIASFQNFGATMVQFQKMEQRFGGGGPPPEEERLRPNLTLDDAEAIKRYAWAVQYVSPERWTSEGVDVRYRGQRANGPTIGGVTHAYPDTNNHFVKDGRFFTAGEELHSAQVCVLGVGIVEALFPREDPLGREISINGRPFRVIGVFEKKGSFLDQGADQQMVVPIGMLDRIFPRVKETYGCVIATLPRKPEWVNLTIEQGTQILRDRRGLRFSQANNFAVRTPDRFIRTFRQITGGISAAMVVIAGISLIIGGVGVMNIMLMSVTQRTREIGVRRALGARQRDIRQQFQTEAITLALVGGATGVAIGLGVSKLLGAVSPFPTSISATAIFAGLTVSGLVGYFFGTYPAFKAARLDPIEALRYE
ncbi:MAG TPA: ABC transporter permease [Thermoanaerobaculaceae bacterium]|nr:ABC transporter permease [Thermoanaerobaculaceae bacterium]